jgi:hypothetical protein
VYEEFVESFKADEAPSGSGRDGGSGVKAFVRGGVVAPGSKPHEAPLGAFPSAGVVAGRGCAMQCHSSVSIRDHLKLRSHHAACSCVGQSQNPPGGATGGRYVPAGAAAAAAAAAGAAPGGAGGSGKRFEPGRVHQRHDAFADDEDEEDEVRVCVARVAGLGF